MRLLSEIEYSFNERLGYTVKKLWDMFDFFAVTVDFRRDADWVLFKYIYKLHDNFAKIKILK